MYWADYTNINWLKEAIITNLRTEMWKNLNYCTWSCIRIIIFHIDISFSGHGGSSYSSGGGFDSYSSGHGGGGGGGGGGYGGGHSGGFSGYHKKK